VLGIAWITSQSGSNPSSYLQVHVMDEVETARSAKFLIQRRGADAAKQWAAQRALEVTDAESRAAWLRILQAIIDLNPASGADTLFN
jgi:hypothetical protein